MDIDTVIEHMGKYFGDSGRTPMRGRVFGYLLAAEPKTCDFKTIRQTLGASKGSISSALNSLLEQGLIRSYTRNEKRKRYFAIDVQGWLARSKQDMLSAARFNDILRSGKALRQQHKPTPHAGEAARDLDVMINFHEEFHQQVEAFIETWDSRLPE